MFSPDIDPQQQQTVQSALDDLRLAAGSHCMKPFSFQEVAGALSRLKTGKSIGLTGMSAEMFRAMWAVPGGQALLLQFFNDLLQCAGHPPELQCGFVSLVPKVAEVLKASDVRPINLIEVANKMYCILLTQRLVPNWSAPPVQCGALAGGQVLDALAAGQWAVQQESSTGRDGIRINADIQSALDSLSHVAIADFVLAHTPAPASREALQL